MYCVYSFPLLFTNHYDVWSFPKDGLYNKYVKSDKEWMVMQHQCPLGLGSVLVIFVSLQAYDPGICIDKILTQVQCRNLSTGGAGSLGLRSNTSRCIFAFLVASRPAALHSVFGPKKGLNEFVQCFDMDYVYKETLDLGRGKVA